MGPSCALSAQLRPVVACLPSPIPSTALSMIVEYLERYTALRGRYTICTGMMSSLEFGCRGYAGRIAKWEDGKGRVLVILQNLGLGGNEHDDKMELSRGTTTTTEEATCTYNVVSFRDLPPDRADVSSVLASLSRMDRSSVPVLEIYESLRASSMMDDECSSNPQFIVSRGKPISFSTSYPHVVVNVQGTKTTAVVISVPRSTIFHKPTMVPKIALRITWVALSILAFARISGEEACFDATGWAKGCEWGQGAQSRSLALLLACLTLLAKAYDAVFVKAEVKAAQKSLRNNILSAQRDGNKCNKPPREKRGKRGKAK